MKWMKWSCGFCGRRNYARSPVLPSSPRMKAACGYCGRSGSVEWEETRPPEKTVSAEETFWQCPTCRYDNEAMHDRSGASLEECGECHRECGVLWLGTLSGPLGPLEI